MEERLRTNDELRVLAVEALQKAARICEAAATSYALSAARRPDDKVAQAAAVAWVTKHDARLQMGEEAIKIVNGLWPRDVAPE